MLGVGERVVVVVVDPDSETNWKRAFARATCNGQPVVCVQIGWEQLVDSSSQGPGHLELDIKVSKCQCC